MNFRKVTIGVIPLVKTNDEESGNRNQAAPNGKGFLQENHRLKILWEKLDGREWFS